MIELTTMHMDVLRQIAEWGLVDATNVVAELAGEGYIKRNRYRLGEGWQYDLTDSGKALLSPTPALRGPARLDTWMD